MEAIISVSLSSGEDYSLDPVAASILLGQCVEYDLGNMYDPAYTMVCKLSKRFLK